MLMLKSSQERMGDVMTVKQVAEYLGISVGAAYRLRMLIPSSKAPGVGVRFRKSDVDEYLRKHEKEPISAAVQRRPPRIVNNARTEIVPGMSEEDLKKAAGF